MPSKNWKQFRFDRWSTNKEGEENTVGFHFCSFLPGFLISITTVSECYLRSEIFCFSVSANQSGERSSEGIKSIESERQHQNAIMVPVLPFSFATLASLWDKTSFWYLRRSASIVWTTFFFLDVYCLRYLPLTTTKKIRNSCGYKQNYNS